MGSHFVFSRRGPDSIMEELVAELLKAKSCEFQSLFKTVHIALQSRNIGGGEEMIRLRTYEKLQNLVLHGQVKKSGRKYRGIRKPLLILAESLKILRQNGRAPFQK